MSYMAWSELSTILGASGDRDEVPAKRGLFGRRR